MEKLTQRAYLVTVDLPQNNDTLVSFAELEALAKTAGAEIAGKTVQKRDSIHPQTCVGTGKLEEIKAEAEKVSANLLIFDIELSPIQIFNIEETTQMDVIDRTILIMDIFAQRARSSEGKLQVELAQLQYMLPRLKGSYGSLSKQGGGIGTRGPGESKLETDKRHIRRKITYLKEKLEQVDRRRQTGRDKIKSDSIKFAALAGYTNAGKSTLLNSLTSSDVYVEDMLFATLDPSYRVMKLSDNRDIYVCDTVGFIRRLPHHLIEAFKSTLDVVKDADLVLYVCDAASPEIKDEMSVCLNLISEIGYKGKIITVFNKWDKVTDKDNPVYLMPDSCKISALNKAGLEGLINIIERNLPEKKYNVNIRLPYNKSSLLNKIIEKYKVNSTEYKDDGVYIILEIDGQGVNKYKEYIIAQTEEKLNN